MVKIMTVIAASEAVPTWPHNNHRANAICTIEYHTAWQYAVRSCSLVESTAIKFWTSPVLFRLNAPVAMLSVLL